MVIYAGLGTLVSVVVGTFAPRDPISWNAAIFLLIIPLALSLAILATTLAQKTAPKLALYEMPPPG